MRNNLSPHNYSVSSVASSLDFSRRLENNLHGVRAPSSVSPQHSLYIMRFSRYVGSRYE